MSSPARGAAIASTAILMVAGLVVAYHGLNATFPRGTLGGMIADIGWSDDDLRRLGLL